MSTNTELSNLSYTNKDFNSIYAELLEYARAISYKWDPTASDESDPGVVLLKLAALIGDKDNYNIDKNVLELMPVSVTQLAAARQLFDQCGYSMKYYQAASGELALTVKQDFGDNLDEAESYNYTIPQFTMFCDQDSSIVYTSTKDVTAQSKTVVSVPVLEGTIVKYTVNNDPLITSQHLDSNNRIYFAESNVAQNGIFIKNVASSDVSAYRDIDAEWQAVDNLQTQPKGYPCFKFGITIDSSVCYIEFPDDAEFLIGEGININYILTSGSVGNVAAGKINEFYVDTKFIRSGKSLAVETVEVDATTEHVVIRNLLPTVNGQDPESIDSAYKNYKRVRDTFNTLVSLKDYSDYIVTSECASNGYVCDRTNDIQRTCKVVTTVNDSTYVKTKVLADSSSNPLMNAFNLSVYALQYMPVVTTDAAFKSSFQIVDLNNTSKLDEALSDSKSLQHDFLNFEFGKILMIKNKYPVFANIVPRYPLSTTEKFQVLSNVESALCKALNSNEVSFGEGISSELIQSTILGADERIKTLIDFMSPTYQTYAVYMKKTDNGGAEFDEIRIDFDSKDAGYVKTSVTRSTFDSETHYVLNVNGKFEKAEKFSASETYYEYVEDLSNLWKAFRAEVFAKNVLAGITPLYDDANTYTHRINQTNLHEYTPVTKISTNATITLTYETNTGEYVSPELKENENILLTAPNFVEENNFSSYVRVLYDFPSASDPIKADTQHKLHSGDSDDSDDFIIFFWKESDASDDYTYIKYDSSENSPAKFISPSGFTLQPKQTLTSASETNVDAESVIEHFRSKPAGKGKTRSDIVPATPFVKDKSYSESEFVNKCLKNESNNQVLTGVKIIKTTDINKIEINNTVNGCKYVYWFLNEKHGGEYTLFNERETSYTLKSGEYFVYTNDAKSVLHIQGQGTLITRDGTWSSDQSWSVSAIPYEDLILDGIDALEGKWYTIPKSDVNVLCATEQQQILIGPENKLIVTPHENSEIPTELNSKESTPINGTLSYQDSSSNRHSIPEISGAGEGWSAITILNLNMSATDPQILYNGHEITVTAPTLNSDSPFPITGSDDTPVYVQCSEELNMLGNQNIDIESLFPKKDVGILTYNIISGETDIEKDITNSSVDLKVTSESTQYTFSCIPGQYLLQLSTSKQVDDFGVSSDSEGVTLEQLQSSNTYKLYVETVGNSAEDRTEDGTEVTLNFKYESDGDLIVSVLPLFKYTDTTLRSFDVSAAPDSQLTFEQAVLDKIKVLDTSTEYNYTYRPNNPIKNPLIASEFLRKLHYYNQYTICEWDTNVSDNITIHDVIR